MNSYLGEERWSVWMIEGRRGNQIRARFNHWLWVMKEGGDRPVYVSRMIKKPIVRERTPEHNEKISRALSGKGKDSSHCQSISQAMLGNRNRG